MSDPRLIPANAHVAHISLQGEVEADRFVEGDWRQVARAHTDILEAPGGARQRQALYGEQLLVLDVQDGVAFAQAAKDGYVGYVDAEALAAAHEPTHWVSAPATHLYTKPDIKSPEAMRLSFGAQLKVKKTRGAFSETSDGLFVPSGRITPLGQTLSDPAGVATGFLGTPYLWGGNTRDGIDCSGLVQAALIACGIDCPGDSDLQEQALGETVPEDAALLRGDLLFWKGHVAICMDGATMLHANAHHMGVAFEGIRDGIARIERQGDGKVTGCKRIMRTT